MSVELYHPLDTEDKNIESFDSVDNDTHPVQQSLVTEESDNISQIQNLDPQQLVTPTLQEIATLEKKGIRRIKASRYLGLAVFAAGIHIVTSKTSTTKPTLENFIGLMSPALSFFSVSFVGAKLGGRFFKKADAKYLERQENIHKIKQSTSTQFAPTLAGTEVAYSAKTNPIIEELPNITIGFKKDDVAAQKRDIKQRLHYAIESNVAYGIDVHFDFMTRTIRQILATEYSLAGVDANERLETYDKVMADKKRQLLQNKEKIAHNKLSVLSTDKDITELRTALSQAYEMPNGKNLAPGLPKN